MRYRVISITPQDAEAKLNQNPDWELRGMMPTPTGAVCVMEVPYIQREAVGWGTTPTVVEPEAPSRRRTGRRRPLRDYGEGGATGAIMALLGDRLRGDGIDVTEVYKLAAKHLGMPSGTVSSSLHQLYAANLLVRQGRMVQLP